VRHRPTLRQLEVLRAIDRLTRVIEVGPTIRELSTEIGVKSTNATAAHKRLLGLKGLVSIDKAHRSMVLTPLGKFFAK